MIDKVEDMAELRVGKDGSITLIESFLLPDFNLFSGKIITEVKDVDSSETE